MIRNKNNRGGRKPIHQDATQVKEQPGGAPPSIVVQKLDIMPIVRNSQNMDKWRAAIASAESAIPYWLPLYQMYVDVELDPQIEAVTGKILDAVLSANWSFVDKDGTPVDDINELIDTIGFDTLITEITKSKWWGTSMVEPKFFKNHRGNWEMSCYVMPKQNMRPHLGVIAFDQITNDGINIRKGRYAKTIMEVGDPKDLGLHKNGAAYQILKRGGVGDYAMAIQLWGEPIVDALWDGVDTKQRDTLKEAIKTRGAGGAFIHPKGTELELMLANGNSTGQFHVRFLQFLDKQIAKNYLGATETVESSESSGNTQAKTHSEQTNIKFERYITYVRKILNSRFIKILDAGGFNTSNGRFVIEGEEQELSKKESFEMHKSMAKDLGLPIDDDFWYETYGVPKPDNYEQLKKEQTAMRQAQGAERKIKSDELDKKPSAKRKAQGAEQEEKEVKLFEKFLNLFSFQPRERGDSGSLLRPPHHTD